MLTARNNNKNKGFSLTETAIMLIIVVLMASTALPKLTTSLKSEDISVVSTAGEFDNAVRLARAQWFANGQSGIGRIEGFGDGRVWSSERGWPISYKASKPPVSIDAIHCANVWNGIMKSEGAPRAAVSTGADWQAQRGDRAEVCQYTATLGSKQHVISYNTKSGKVSYQ